MTEAALGDDLADDAARPSGALLRGLEVLKAFQPGRGELGNADISAVTGLPKATVSRLTRALVDAGYLDHDVKTSSYRLRPRVLTLGFSLLSNLPILSLAHEHMQQLARISGCTVSLAAADGNDMIYLDRCGGESMPYFFSVGSTIDMAMTSSGRAYLAGLPEDLRAQRLAALAPHYGAAWPSLLPAIENAAAQVADHGFCLVDQTWRKNIRAIAAPIIAPDRRTVLSVGCVAPAHALEAERLVAEWGPPLFHVAQTLSSRL